MSHEFNEKLCSEVTKVDPKLTQNYNKLYSENETTFGEGRPGRLARDLHKYRNSGTLLDVGAGDGRNALYLAREGFVVTARDIAATGLEKLSARAEAEGLKVATEVGDVRDMEGEGRYDVLLCTYVLHHMPREDALAVIRSMQEHTSSGGLNAVSTFTDKGEFYERDAQTSRFYPVPHELADLYAGWDILQYEEREMEAYAKHEDGTPMRNVVAHLIACKV